MTAYAYDPAGNLTHLALPDGSYLSFSYDAAHRLIGMADALGNHIAYTLDAAGNRTQRQLFDPSGTLTQTRARVYDAISLLERDIDAYSNATIYNYDNNGNRTLTRQFRARSGVRGPGRVENRFQHSVGRAYLLPPLSSGGASIAVP